MSEHRNATVVRRIAAYGATGVGLTVVLAAFGELGWQGNDGLHTQLEIIATVLAAIIGSMALARFYSRRETTFLFIGCGFLGTAFLDAYHAFVTSEFFMGLESSELASQWPWSWLASRYFLTISIFLSWLTWWREERLGERGRTDERVVYLGTFAFIAVVVAILAMAKLPPGHLSGLYFPRPWEFGTALLFLAALVGYLRKALWRREMFEHCLVLFLILGVVGQAFFMSRSGALHDYEFNVGHLLKIAGYACVLIGLLGNVLAIYREADHSERRFRSAISNMQEGFALFDADDRLVTYNNEYLRLHPGLGDVIELGVRFEDLIRISVERGKIADAVGREQTFIRQRMRQHRNPVGPILRELSDGTWYLINEAKMPDGSIAVTETDITELKDAETALRAREKLTRQMLEASPVGVLIVTRDGKHLFANERALEIQGVTRGQLMASNAGDYYVDPALRVRLKDELYRTGFTPPTPVELLKPDGAHYFVILSSTLTEFEGRQAHLTYLYDISDLKRTEQALRDSEARLRSVVDNIIDGIVTIDTTGMILSVNAAAARIFGYEEFELVGHNVNTLMPEPHHSSHDRYLANYLTTGIPKFMGAVRDVEGRRRNGRRFPMEIAVNEVSFGDERLFVGIVRDITERKEMERLKGEFVSTVSHELRTPLTSIRGSLGLLSAGVVGKLPKKARALVDLAEMNASRLINLVNDILDIEKIESGKMEFRFRPVDLKNLVEQGVEANRGYADAFDVNFIVAAAPPGIVVRGDADRLTQVLANLLSNAAKFSPRGEKVEITCARFGAVGRVSVSDCGPGIAKEFRKDIFGKFTQADSSDARKVGGTGLGLNISKSIIEKHGGLLAFDTKVGTGTTFYFEVPIWDGSAEAADAATQPRGLRVLSR
jgi:PAS domain S-box-containing protein